MEAIEGRNVTRFRGRLILKVALATLIPVAVTAGLGFFWEYREDRKAAENVILHEMSEEAFALASAVEAAGKMVDVRTIVANYLRNISAEAIERTGGLKKLGLSKIFVVDGAGMVVAGGRPELIGKPLVEALGHGPMGVPAVLSGREAWASEFTVADGIKVIHISVPVRLDPLDPARVTGAVHLMEPYALMEEVLWPGVWRRAGVAFALTLALAGSLILILGVVVVAPLRRLTDAIRRTTQRGENVTVPVTSTDEIGDLTQSFNQMVAELHRRRSTLEALYAINRAVSESLDVEVVLAKALEKACEVLGAEAGGFHLLEADGETLGLRVYQGASPGFAEGVRRIRLGEGVSGQAMALRQPVAMEMANYPASRLAPFLVAEGFRSLASAPIIARGRSIGAISLGRRSARPFTKEELDLLGSIGLEVAASVENAQLHALTAGQAQRLAMLTELARSLTMVLEPAAVAQEILRAVQALIPGSAGRLWERAGDEDVLNVVAGVGLQDPRGGQQIRFSPGEGLTGIAAATRQPVISPDVTRDPRFANQAWATAEGLVSCIVLPLVHGERILGGLAIFTRTAHAFTDDEVSLLRSFAAQAAIALENARLFQSVSLHREQLRTLTARLADAEETQRRRISRELHDRVAQNLTALGLNLNIVRSQWPDEFAAKTSARLDDSLRLVEETVEHIRDVMAELRPPVLDDYGLGAALRWYSGRFETLTGVTTLVEGEELSPRLPQEVEMPLFRIAQEAMMNVARHVRASQVTIRLEAAAGRVRLTVADNGAGFDPALKPGQVEPPGWGLITMRERAAAAGGQLRVESAPGKGTRVVVELVR